MWITCYQCKGSGHNMDTNMDTMFHEGTDLPSYVCIICYTPFWWEDKELRGKLWIEDNMAPITPPSSPSIIK